ncbi:hypothetical protein ACFE35_12260 [Phormidesmis priestleyi ANT.L61.2]
MTLIAKLKNLSVSGFHDFKGRVFTLQNLVKQAQTTKRKNLISSSYPQGVELTFSQLTTAG